MQINTNQSEHKDNLLLSLISRYHQVRQDSLDICAPLEKEDYTIQTCSEVSPPKWHLAHTTWFFESFILNHYQPDYKVYHPQFDYLFNSYYETVGKPFPRAQRGLLSRPTVEEVLQYRQYVDKAITELLEHTVNKTDSKLEFLLALGLNHEQQHQELLYTDIKHIFAFNPLRPVYKPRSYPSIQPPERYSWLDIKAGTYNIGNEQNTFAYDNEGPRHRVLLDDFSIANRPVNNQEYLEFIEDDGYKNPALWLADGWKHMNNSQCHHPLYWEKKNDEWWYMTLSGLKPVDLSAPVTHVSFYEADAYARWCGHRLPSEAEWEIAADAYPANRGNYRETGLLQPIARPEAPDFFGNVWEWTQSPYQSYPGFKPLQGSIGEYNGKFMCNQMVLRGGSCVSPVEHLRHSYRNFFYPHERWQFTGIRLAKD